MTEQEQPKVDISKRALAVVDSLPEGKPKLRRRRHGEWKPYYKALFEARKKGHTASTFTDLMIREGLLAREVRNKAISSFKSALFRWEKGMLKDF